jgi:hypothetical protein
MFRILASAAVLIGAMTAAHADVYRWTDAQGHVQYSDRWVPGSTLIKGTSHYPGAQQAPAATEQPKVASSNATPTQQQREVEQTVKHDVAATRAEQCKKATEAYEKAIASRRLYKEGKDGEREYISDTDADAYRAKLLSDRQQLCGK